MINCIVINTGSDDKIIFLHYIVLINIPEYIVMMIEYTLADAHSLYLIYASISAMY